MSGRKNLAFIILNYAEISTIIGLRHQAMGARQIKVLSKPGGMDMWATQEISHRENNMTTTLSLESINAGFSCRRFVTQSRSSVWAATSNFKIKAS